MASEFRMIPPYQDIATLAQHICTSERTIESWVKLGIFPAPRVQGAKRLWSWKDVERHLAGESDTAHTSLTQRITDGTRRAAENSR